MKLFRRVKKLYSGPLIVTLTFSQVCVFVCLALCGVCVDIPYCKTTLTELIFHFDLNSDLDLGPIKVISLHT